MEEKEQAESSEETQKAAASEAALRDKLQEDLEKERVARARAEGQVEAFAKQPPSEIPKTDPPKRYTVAQLQEMVDSGAITDIEKEQRLHDQLRAELRDDARTLNAENLKSQKSTSKIDVEFEAYKKVVPGIDEPGSENHRRASAEYAKLLALEIPESAALQLVAIRNVFGPAEKIPETTERETHAEGAGGQSAVDSQQKPSGWRGDCSKDEVAYYEEMIKTGQYDGEDDPNFRADVDFAVKRRKAH